MGANKNKKRRENIKIKTNKRENKSNEVGPWYVYSPASMM
jgi:hypothetical protein